MMLSHPVLLGFVWSLLVLSTSGQTEISNNESNKVYAYSYHFQHNGTTNSKEILRSVLGTDPEFGLDNLDGKSIVKTFSSPGIRGFFTKGVLPAGPISQSFSNGINNSPFSNIRKIVESNLQPPRDVATGLLPPISPDISRDFPGNYNNVNDLGNIFQNQDDFPKIPTPPVRNIFQNQNDFSKIPPLPVIPNNVGNRNVENFARDTPDGGRVVGRVETFSYNPPAVTNSISRTEENSEGYRRNENILNNNREVTGHRTQSFFRTNFRTVTPNFESNNYNSHSGVDSRNSGGNNNNNNQWWNVLNVLGNGNNHVNPTAPHINQDVNQNINQEVNKNINEIQNNINRAFGTRLSGFRRQNGQNELVNNRQNNFGNQNTDNYRNQNRNFNNPQANQNYNNPRQTFNNPLMNQNFNNPLAHQNFNNPLNINRAIPNTANTMFSREDNGNYPQNVNNNYGQSNVQNPGFNINKPVNINVHPNPNSNFNNNPQFNENTEKKVLNLIHDVSDHLKNMHNNNNQRVNINPVWDDDVTRNVNNDWSTRRRPFSNGHSGPSNGPQSVDMLKTALDALNRNTDIPRNQGDSYRNVDGGGFEKVFGFDKTVEGPNSYSRNQQRGYERDFQVNSNSGYNRNNQWSSNTVRRLDAQSSKSDFSTDFIDVFRDD